MMESQRIDVDTIKNGYFIQIPASEVRVGMSIAVVKHKTAFVANVIADHVKYFEFHGGWKCEKGLGKYYVYHDCDLGI